MEPAKIHITLEVKDVELGSVGLWRSTCQNQLDAVSEENKGSPR